MSSGFSFDKMVIVQSLGGPDILTGDILHGYISSICEVEGIGLPVQLINCASGADFLSIIESMVVEARAGTIPLLHVECHGDPSSGLDFSDGSDLGWSQIAEALVKLNVATRFNLMAVFSACFGFYFVEKMGAIERAPCWCLVAPTSIVYEFEIMEAFRGFYRDLFVHRDVSLAFRTLSKYKLKEGGWICTVAEEWFERLVVDYIKKHCSIRAGDARIKRYFRYAKSKQLRWSKGFIKRIFSSRNRYNLLNKYFNRYFLVGEVPENFLRFQDVRKRIDQRLMALRSTKKYYI
jgi:hypothetical protein